MRSSASLADTIIIETINRRVDQEREGVKTAIIKAFPLRDHVKLDGSFIDTVTRSYILLRLEAIAELN